jgi:spore cortex formation protein SpoVR/YcgB (stage V sporulation)
VNSKKENKQIKTLKGIEKFLKIKLGTKNVEFVELFLVGEVIDGDIQLFYYGDEELTSSTIAMVMDNNELTNKIILNAVAKYFSKNTKELKEFTEFVKLYLSQNEFLESEEQSNGN